MIQISGNSARVAQNSEFYQNFTNNKVENFLKPSFWPKSNMRNSACTKPLKFTTLTQLTCIIILSVIGERLQSYRKFVTEIFTKGLLSQTYPDKIFWTK